MEGHQSEEEDKVEQNLEEAMKTKAIGTESFKTKDFQEAINKFSLAI